MLSRESIPKNSHSPHALFLLIQQMAEAKSSDQSYVVVIADLEETLDAVWRNGAVKNRHNK